MVAAITLSSSVQDADVGLKGGVPPPRFFVCKFLERLGLGLDLVLFGLNAKPGGVAGRWVVPMF